MPNSPFKFLDSYTRDDRAIFFGRDREIEELYQRVFDSKLLLVYGVSGTGKSSLIHCGLANKFSETDWLPLVIRRGGNIIESMASGIKAASLTEQHSKFAGPSDFKKAVKSLYLDHYKPVFFIFDQFEELFIFGDKEERRSFVQIVKSLIESDLQCRLIFVMREEYMAWITEFEKFIPSFFANRVRIEKMSHTNAMEAITEPCKVFNISLENGFAETLLEKLSPGGTEVELTYLQVFLDKVFRISQKEKSSESGLQKTVFSLSLLSEIGNVSDLLGSFLDDQIAQMDDPDTAMSVLKAFVSGKGTKRPASENETVENVRALGKELALETVIEFLQTFVRLRVLRDKDDHGRYELRHDALAEKVYEKFSLAEKELLELRQLIENAYQYFLKRKVLLTNDDLNYISDRDSLLNLKPDIQNFMEESRVHQKKIKRTLKQLTSISALAFIILFCILGYFVKSKIAHVDANYMAVKSISQTANPVTRLKLAGSAWEKSQGAMSKEALLKAFNSIINSQEKDSVMNIIAAQNMLEFDTAPINIEFAECSKDDKYVYGYGDSLIFIWNRAGKLEKTFRTDHFPIIDIKISDDGSFIGAVSSDSFLTIWNGLGKLKFIFKIQYNELNTKQIFKFTKENKVISVCENHDAVILDLDGRELQTFDRHKGSVNAIAISPDNNFIATASSDKTMNIWYFNSVKKRFDFYNCLEGWHSDTIWSVNFASNNIGVISASADSTVVIGNINNEIIYGLWSDFFSAFLGQQKFCYAEFTSSKKGFTAIHYQYNGTGVLKSYFAMNYNNPKVRIRNRTGEHNKNDSITAKSILEGVYGLRFLSFSNDENYFACGDRNHIFLVDNRLGVEKERNNLISTYTLLELEGANPFFTSDSRYLLYIDRKRIGAFFINVEAIYKISQNIPE